MTNPQSSRVPVVHCSASPPDGMITALPPQEDPDVQSALPDSSTELCLLCCHKKQNYGMTNLKGDVVSCPHCPSGGEETGWAEIPSGHHSLCQASPSPMLRLEGSLLLGQELCPGLPERAPALQRDPAP